jgi:hypothetical protein
VEKGGDQTMTGTGKEHTPKRPRFSIIQGVSSAEQVQDLASKFDIDLGASSQTEKKEELDVSEVVTPTQSNPR